MRRRNPGPWWCLLLVWLLCGRAFATEATLTADTHVNAALPGVNSGTISNINVGGGFTGLLQFDLGTLPAGTTSAQVSRAILRLYVNRVDTAGTVAILPLNAAWSEYGVSYSTLPGVGTAAGSFNVGASGGYVAIDVTALVQAWVAAPATNHGVALTAGTAVAQFDSKENDLTGHAAVLDVGIVSQGPAGVAGPAGVTGPAGPLGPAGVAGMAGPAGAAGLAGPAGVAGAQGLPGAAGPAGIAGPSGSAGPVGPAGAKGDSGFTYQGTYDSTANYAKGDVVLYAGSSYLSLVAGNHGNTPGASPAAWGLVASGASGTGSGGTGTGTGTGPGPGVAYQGNYLSSTNYGLNDIVLYAGSSYISLVAANHGNTPGTSTSWGLLAAGGTGVVGPVGPPGPAGTQGAQGLPGIGFQGPYSSATNYGLDDVVSWQGSSYISLTASNHGNTPSLSPANWAVLAAAGVGTAGATGATGATGPQGLAGPVGATGAMGAQGPTGLAGARGLPGLVYQGAYVSGTNYALGDVVLWQGASWTSLVEGNHGNTPSFSPAYWGVLTQQGPAGVTGPTGAPGPAGATGALGPVGPPGERGDQGLQGIAGQAGAQGLTGARGDPGLSGPAGPQGVAGPAGLSFRGNYSSSVNYALADGVQYNGSGYVSLVASNHGNTPDQSPAAWAVFAAAGVNGATGTVGPAGLTGAQGSAGPQGPAGPTGATGSVGPQGPAVANFLGNYASTANYAVADAVSYGGSTYVSLVAGNHGNTPDASPSDWSVLVKSGQSGVQGPTGPAGPQGPTGAAGVIGPAGPQGAPVAYAGGWLLAKTYAVGDTVGFGGSSYIATVANVGRAPDVSPAYWGVLASIGLQGATGAQGLQGATGAQGDRGAQGLQGVAGQAGAQGLTGAKGDAGLSGPAGPQGSAGPAGMNFRGTYDSSVNYALADGVQYKGAGYVSLVAGNHGNAPDQSAAAWSLFAAAGVNGATGAAGPAGATGPQGAAGSQGLAGPVGAAGAVGPQGPAVANYLGAYSSTTNYAVSDAVAYGGSTYVSLVAGNHGNTPDASPSYWSVLVKAGANGPAGSVGPAGPQGPAGAAGPAGMNGVQGPPVAYAGAWAVAKTYAIGDTVIFAGSSYIATAPSSGRQPDVSAAYWGVLASIGLQGATGAQGLQGMTGAPGDRGAQGLQGIAGQAGAAGPAGAKGDTGLSGPAGSQGVAGPAGMNFRGVYDPAVNYALADGVQYKGAGYVSVVAANHGNAPDQSPSAWSLFAAAGANGSAGVAGPAGAIGPPGSAGAQGLAGPTGAAGAVGPQGPAVANFLGNYSATVNYAVADAVSYGGSTWVSLVAGNHGNAPDASPSSWAVLVKSGESGVQGPAGPAGPQGPSGAGGATGTIGPQGPPVAFAGGWSTSKAYVVGDAVSFLGSSYIAVAANVGMQPDLSPAYWAVLASVGSAGPAGTSGPQGLQGPTGYPGATGTAGPQGASGPAGPVGGTGPAGVSGPAGPAGPTGATGTAGLTYRGAYDPGTNYGLNDGVSYGGASYISLAAGNAGNPPGVSGAWGLLAAQGSAGAAGAAGVNGSNGATGATGAAGPQGVQGPAGAAGANGTASLVYQGGYSAGANYGLNDAVTYNGSSYLSLVAGNHGNLPAVNPAAWALLASAGAAGSQGVAGPAGATGGVGATGAAGPQGSAGATGAAGINFRGAWTAGTGYGVNDGVTFGGSSWLAQVSNSSVQPGSNAQVWAVLAAQGSAASVGVGTVVTGAAGSAATVTNGGTAQAAVLNFILPQGAAGATGPQGPAGPAGAAGTGGTSAAPGIPYVAMYHAVSYAATYYSLTNTNQSASETAAVLTWVPLGCSATRLDVFSQQGATITVTLRVGTPGAMADSALSCQVSQGRSCSGTGAVSVAAGQFVDVGITHSDSNPVGVWTAVACQ